MGAVGTAIALLSDLVISRIRSQVCTLTWYCAQIHVGQEQRASIELARQGVVSFLPCFLVKQRDRHVARRLLFSNYLFIKLVSPSDWPVVEHSYGVNRMLVYPPSQCEYYMPQQLTDRSVESLREQALSFDEIQRGGKREEQLPRSLITAGCYVKVNAGVFKDEAFAQKALVDWADAERALLLLTMFKREIKVEFYHRDLILLASDSGGVD